ncbi:unnamed protein product [Lactuca saligna]|uniref:Secreted protein n=1 Tax=Lactuca saligna TaxID=75948 RepID=A0AA36E1Y1_LACSI|nr:unnamed protein product [Lactuca saligna]
MLVATFTTLVSPTAASSIATTAASTAVEDEGCHWGVVSAIAVAAALSGRRELLPIALSTACHREWWLCSCFAIGCVYCYFNVMDACVWEFAGRISEEGHHGSQPWWLSPLMLIYHHLPCVGGCVCVI